MDALEKLNVWCERFRKADLLEQYDILLDQGLRLAKAPGICTESRQVQGCKVKFYMEVSKCEGRLKILAQSDSLLVCGVIAIIIDIYDGTGEKIGFFNSPIRLTEVIEDCIINPDIKQNGLQKLSEAIEAAASKG